MKNIEKIAIDSMVEAFATKNQELIANMVSSKAAVEVAQQNFKKSAGPVLTHAKEVGALLIADEISEEATKYFEDKMSEIIKMPFSTKEKPKV